MFDRIGVIFRKELTDHLRDRRTIITSLFYPLMGPLIVLLVFTVLGQSVAQRTERALELPVAGANMPPRCLRFSGSITSVEPAPADPQGVVRAGDVDTVLVIQPSQQLRRRAARRRAASDDQSRSSSNVTVERARKLLEQFNAQVAAERLQARGVAPEVIQTLTIEDVDLATRRAARPVSTCRPIIIFAVLGGAGLAVDMTAGERERGSLEPLLSNGCRAAMAAKQAAAGAAGDAGDGRGDGAGLGLISRVSFRSAPCLASRSASPACAGENYLPRCR